MEKTLYIDGMSCAHCAAHVKDALESVDNVKEATVDLEKNIATIVTDGNVEDRLLTAAIDDAGYTVSKIV